MREMSAACHMVSTHTKFTDKPSEPWWRELMDSSAGGSGLGAEDENAVGQKGLRLYGVPSCVCLLTGFSSIDARSCNWARDLG